MTNEKMREEFEAAVLNSELLPCNSIVKIEGIDEYSSVLTGLAWLAWQASRATPDGYCVVPTETIKKAYALSSSVCGDCYAGEDAESLLANQLTKEISKSDYWMSIK